MSSNCTNSTLSLLLSVDKLYIATQFQHLEHFRQSSSDEFRDGEDSLNQVENAQRMYNHIVEKSAQVEGSAEPGLVSPLTHVFVLFHTACGLHL